MNQYNPEAKCPKCGFSIVNSEFHPKVIKIISDEGDVNFVDENTGDYEYITRKCSRCNYSWDEAPLDTEVEK